MIENKDIRIRKVKMLNDKARAIADSQDLDENDLVILRTTYEIEKIEGSPSEYLQNKIRK